MQLKSFPNITPEQRAEVQQYTDAWTAKMVEIWHEEDFIKYANEWQEGYKIWKDLREREKLYKKTYSGKYDSHTWQYYARKNGFYPEDESVD